MIKIISKELNAAIKEEIKAALIGIDKDECEDPENGWWETSWQVEFGEKKLTEILSIIDKHINAEGIKDVVMVDVPQFILDCPISADWITYRDNKYFAMLNYQASVARGKAMIDLCYCATAGLINNRVLHTIPYNNKMEIFKPQ